MILKLELKNGSRYIIVRFMIQQPYMHHLEWPTGMMKWSTKGLINVSNQRQLKCCWKYSPPTNIWYSIEKQRHWSVLVLHYYFQWCTSECIFCVFTALNSAIRKFWLLVGVGISLNLKLYLSLWYSSNNSTKLEFITWSVAFFIDKEKRCFADFHANYGWLLYNRCKKDFL